MFLPRPSWFVLDFCLSFLSGSQCLRSTNRGFLLCLRKFLSLFVRSYSKFAFIKFVLDFDLFFSSSSQCLGVPQWLRDSVVGVGLSVLVTFAFIRLNSRPNGFHLRPSAKSAADLFVAPLLRCPRGETFAFPLPSGRNNVVQ